MNRKHAKGAVLCRALLMERNEAMSKKKNTTQVESMPMGEMWLDHEKTALAHVYGNITRAEKRILLIAESQFKDHPQYLFTLKECKYVWRRARTPKFINGRYNIDQIRYHRVTLRGVTALETLFGKLAIEHETPVNAALVGVSSGLKQVKFRSGQK